MQWLLHDDYVTLTEGALYEPYEALQTGLNLVLESKN